MKRRIVQLEKEESQNENGRGPGRTSAVTNFVRRAGQESRAVKPSMQTSAPKAKTDKKTSVPVMEVGNRGRLAAARQGKR